MSISVKCTDCGKSLKAPDALAGKKAKCPDCGATVPIPKAMVEAEEIHDEPAESYDDEYGSPAADSEARKPCPMCGEMIVVAAAKCRYCGEVFDGRVSKSGRRKRSGTGEYATFGTRFVAAIVDGILVQIIAAILGGIAGAVIGAIAGGARANQQNIVGIAQAVGGIIGLITGWLYSALQESSEKQATIGKKMLGIKVTDLEGNRISFGRATGRHFAKIVSGLICLIGYIMAGFTEKKQALHDMMAGTLVVRD